MSHERWNAQQWRRAKEMLERGYSIAAVASLFGRPPKQISSKLAWENMSQEDRRARRARVNQLRNASGEYKSTPRPDKPSVAARASLDLLEERDRRLAVPRTLGAELMGDPRPGYSALDRKRQGVDG